MVDRASPVSVHDRGVHIGFVLNPSRDVTKPKSSAKLPNHRSFPVDHSPRTPSKPPHHLPIFWSLRGEERGGHRAHPRAFYIMPTVLWSARSTGHAHGKGRLG